MKRIVENVKSWYQIQKLKDYEWSPDICTFKTEFKKVYIRSTPQRLLANVLKNNFLKDSAISGEKRRAYQRNKEPFNNNKRRSKNNAPQKMSALNNFTPLWKALNFEKTSDDLIGIINKPCKLA